LNRRPSKAQEQAQGALAPYRQESKDGPVSAECARMLAEALEALLFDPASITL